MSMQVLSRRGCLRGLAGLALVGAAPARAAETCQDGDEAATATAVRRGVPLGKISDRVIWGAAIEAPGLYDKAMVEALTAEAPKCLAIASGVKFGNLLPHEAAVPSLRAWGECDDIVALAAKLGVPVRADCLAWNDWLPGWLTVIARDRAPAWQGALRHHFESYFESVFDHFADRRGGGAGGAMRWCGVVNEPFNPWAARGGKLAWRRGAWLDAYGLAKDGVPGYIHEAFVLGERFRGKAKSALFLNETNCDNDRYGPLVRPALVGLVDSLQTAGRHVDAIGLESHLMPQWMDDPATPDWKPFVRFLRDLEKRGVEIYLTELDVIDCSLRDLRHRDARVATYTNSFVEAALSVPAVTMVTNWDFSDRYSWLRGDAVHHGLAGWANCVYDPPCPRPTIYDEAMQPKAARRDLARALASRP